MRQETIAQAVPNADPEFVRIMGQFPDPPADIHEAVLLVLPDLHRLFLDKRDAAKRNDREAFAAIAEREARLIERLNAAAPSP